MLTDSSLGELLALYDQYVLALYHDRQDPQEPGQQAIANDCDNAAVWGAASSCCCIVGLLTPRRDFAAMPLSVVAQARKRAQAIFAHHVGQGPVVEGYGATGWRNWLICGSSCNCGWFVVRKNAPLDLPRYFPCSLADCKAILKTEEKT